jgi:hypothetical protein
MKASKFSLIFLSIALTAAAAFAQTDSIKRREPILVLEKSDAERLGLKGPVVYVRTGLFIEQTFDETGRLVQARQSAGCPITEEFKFYGSERSTMFRHNTYDPGGNNYCSTRYGQLIRYLKIPDPRPDPKGGILFSLERTAYGDRNFRTGKFEWVISYLGKAGEIYGFRRTYRFDDAGRMIEDQTIDFDLRVTKIFNYYDGQQSAPSRTELYDQGMLRSSVAYEYLEFDKHGNWTKRREKVDFAGGRPPAYEITRSITYRN